MFGFPIAEKTVFKRNFLRKVFFQMNFKKEIKVVEFEDKVKDIFEDSFPRFVKAQGNGLQITLGNEAPIFQTLDEEKQLIFKSKDGQCTLEIFEHFLRLNFDASGYQSSESIKQLLPKFSKLFENCIDVIDTISLKKINIIEFDSSSDSIGILNYLLDKSLIGNLDAFPNTQLINHNLQSVNYRNENFFLNLKYGMNLPPIPNLKIGQVIIDIECVKHTKTDVLNIEDIFEDLNTEIFNVFIMLINENTKKLLNG